MGSVLLGMTLESESLTSTGVLPSVLCLSIHFDFNNHFLLSDWLTAQSEWSHYPINTTPVSSHMLIVWPGPRSFTLLTESLLFSLPVGTEIFHFPTFPPTALYIQAEVAGHYSGFFQGFPIRTSTDQSSFTSSPWLIAGYNVLHRLLVPRHPPIALSSLFSTKMLASTVKFSKYGRV